MKYRMSMSDEASRHNFWGVKVVTILVLTAMLLGACGTVSTNVQAAVEITSDTAVRAAVKETDTDLDSQIEEVRALLSAEMSRVGGGPLAQEEEYDPLAVIDSYNYLQYWLSTDADYEQTSTWGTDHKYRLMWCLNSSGYDFTEAADMLMEDEQYCRFLLYIILNSCEQNDEGREELLDALLNLNDHEQWNHVIDEYREKEMTVEDLFVLIEEPDELYGMDTIIGISALETAAEELLMEKYDTAIDSLSDEDILTYCEAFQLVKDLKGLEYLAIKESVVPVDSDGEGKDDKSSFLAEELLHLQEMSVTDLVYGEDYREYAKDRGDTDSTSGLNFMIIPLEEGESGE